MLFDPVPAEGGRPFDQRLKPGTADTERRTRQGEDTVRGHPLRRPAAGGEGRGPRGGIHRCRGDQLRRLGCGEKKKNKDTRLTQKQEINIPIINQAIIPTPSPHFPNYLPTLKSEEQREDFFFRRGKWDVTNTNSMPRSVRNVE